MLLDNLVHEFNALRGALGEPDRVTFADLSRRVVAVNMTFGDVECHLSWVDLLSGIARYRQEFMFLAPDAAPDADAALAVPAQHAERVDGRGRRARRPRIPGRG